MCLCSVSDDRSIRVWNVSTALDLKPSLNSDDIDLCAWQGASFTVQLVLYGHSARVWDVYILKNSLISVGEVSGNIIIKSNDNP